MHSAKLALRARISECHLVLEVRDARIPFASANPDFDDIIGQKKRLIIFNKTDLADERSFDQVKAYYKARNQPIMFMAGDPVVDKLPSPDKKKRKGDKVGESNSPAHDAGDDFSLADPDMSQLAKKLASKYHVNRTQLRQLHQLIHSMIGPRKFTSVPPVILVLGFPNTGKSTIINAFRSFSKIVAGANASKSFLDSTKEETKKMQRGGVARVGSTPGVTRGVSGFIVSSGLRTASGHSEKLFLLDTPGIMLPYIPSTPTGVALGLKLSAINAIADLVVGDEAICRFMLWSLNRSGQFGYVQHLQPHLTQPTNNLGQLLMAVYRAKHSRTVAKSQLFVKFTKLAQERRLALEREGQPDKDGDDADRPNSPPLSHVSPFDSLPPADEPIAAPMTVADLTSEEMALCTSWFIKAFRRGEFGRITLDTVPEDEKTNSNTNQTHKSKTQRNK